MLKICLKCDYRTEITIVRGIVIHGVNVGSILFRDTPKAASINMRFMRRFMRLFVQLQVILQVLENRENRLGDEGADGDNDPPPPQNFWARTAPDIVHRQPSMHRTPKRDIQ